MNERDAGGDAAASLPSTEARDRFRRVDAVLDAALGVSPATVKREWAIARGWLRRELGAG